MSNSSLNKKKDKKITRLEFYERTGEYPEDVIGQDWENEVEEWLEKEGFNSDDGL